MSENNQKDSTRTMILFIILIPIIGYLLYFAYKKNTESEGKAKACQMECVEKNYNGYDFKWNILSGPQCRCIDF